MPPLRASSLVRNIPDFPSPGIQFKDITPVLADPAAFAEVVEQLCLRAEGMGAQKIVGVESRGFLFGAPMALKMNIGFVPVRKPGKLPSATHKREYALEYGTNTVEIHTDAFLRGERAVVVDDLLATGGTAEAAAYLVEKAGGVVAGYCFALELSFLQGRERLGNYPVEALMTY